jgi:hypothetical protein
MCEEKKRVFDFLRRMPKASFPVKSSIVKTEHIRNEVIPGKVKRRKILW